MTFKRILASAMAVTMMVGGSMTALATGAESAVGTGTNTGHLDTDVFEVILPTSEEVESIFNFTIDPENILEKADLFTDGETELGDDFEPLEDLVYFAQEDGFASTSQAATIEAQNYIDVDVKVEAAIADPEDGKTIIPMVATDEELEAATTPSLLLQLKVGSADAEAITSTGGSAVSTIAGQPDNFAPKYTDGAYVLEQIDEVTWADNTADVQLIGKVKGGTVEETIVAPEVTLTWEVTKHVDGPVATPGSMSTSAKSATISGLDDELTLKSAKVIKADGSEVSLTATTQYTYSNNVFAIVTGKEVLLDATKYSKFVLTYSDDTTIVEIPIVAP